MSLLGKLIDSLLANAPQLKVLPISVALGNGRGVCQRGPLRSSSTGSLRVVMVVEHLPAASATAAAHGMAPHGTAPGTVILLGMARGTLTDGKQFSERAAGRNNTTILL